jgi:hypothetical protein
MKVQAKTAYSGGMTQGSRKRLAKAVTVMTQSIKPIWITNPVTGRLHYHKFSFITLTVSSRKNITARRAYDDLLSHFLDWMTRTIGEENPAAKTYAWKAELQKRGQIHYHITTPAFIHWRLIRDKWNDLQRKAGLLDEYAKEHGHYDANSTDIHDTRSVKHIDRYIIKELAKSVSAVQLAAIREARQMVADGSLPQDQLEAKIAEINAQKLTTVGKIWGCSADLSGVGYFTLELTSAHEQKIEQWIAEGKARKVTDDFFAMVHCDNVDPPDLLSKAETSRFKEYLKKAMDRSSHQEMQAAVIPASCVQMELVDCANEYTVEQLALNFN